MELRLATLALVLATGTACAGDHRVAVPDPQDERAAGAMSLARILPGGEDVLAAGGRVDVRAEVAGDAMLAGGTVHTSGVIGRSLYAAGGSVTIDAPVQRHARIAGGTLEISPRGHVGGNVSAAGGTIRVLGPIGGHLVAGAGQVLIDAPVAGDVDVRAGHLALGPKAAIGGRLRHDIRSALERDPAARVAGGIEPLQAIPRAEPRRAARALGWVWTTGLVLLAALLAALLPQAYDRVRQALEQRPGMSALAGIAAIVCIPVVAVLLLVTIVGIPVGLLALLAYPALLLLGFVSAAVAGGRMALAHWWPARQASRGWQALAAAVCMLLACIAAAVPWLGGLVGVGVLLLGVGALLMAWRTAPAPAESGPAPHAG